MDQCCDDLEEFILRLEEIIYRHGGQGGSKSLGPIAIEGIVGLMKEYRF